jgi:hypothetical protein
MGYIWFAQGIINLEKNLQVRNVKEFNSISTKKKAYMGSETLIQEKKVNNFLKYLFCVQTEY